MTQTKQPPTNPGRFSFRLDGVSSGNGSGSAVAPAGDVNGDGHADLVIGAPFVSSSSGRTYVYFSPVTGPGIYPGTPLADIEHGTSMGDSMNGRGSHDTLFGNGGNDTIMGGFGDDALSGGSGNDLIVGESGNDTMDGGSGDDTLNGSSGIDTASYASASSGVFVSLAISVAQNTLGSGTDTLTNITNLVGSAFDDTLTGTGGDNIIAGGAGNDTLDGAGGNDSADHASAASAVLVSLLLQGSTQNTLGAGTDTLTDFENLLGSAYNDTLGGDANANILSGRAGDDHLIAEAGADTLDGGAGDDTLRGGTGDDIMLGGTGDDTFVVDSLWDAIDEQPGGGFDQAFVIISGWTAAANLEAVYLYGSVTVQLGSASADVLTSNAGGLDTSLDGSGGDDTLWGGNGADTLVGSTGNDVLRGQAGNDVLSGGAGNDQLVGGAGADVFAFDIANWGYDQVFGFSRAEGDRLDMRGSGGFGFEAFTVQIVGSNTALLGGWQRIDVYGVTDLQPSDFIFS